MLLVVATHSPIHYNINVKQIFNAYCGTKGYIHLNNNLLLFAPFGLSNISLKVFVSYLFNKHLLIF